MFTAIATHGSKLQAIQLCTTSNKDGPNNKHQKHGNKEATMAIRKPPWQNLWKMWMLSLVKIEMLTSLIQVAWESTNVYR
eukprot:2148080-Ditylum_brightwellii.AAC.1